MLKINLSNLADSDIKYTISKFPDGQQDIVLDTNGAEISGTTEFAQWSFPIQIKSRFNSFEDLELIICAAKALRRLGTERIHLYIPYLLGSRSDRRFQQGGTSYLVDIIAPILNAQNFDSVTVCDAHSDVAAACINKLIVRDNLVLAEWALDQIITDEHPILISPDAGALKKVYAVAKQSDYKDNVVVCSKYRNLDGKLEHVNVPITGDMYDRDFVVIDDICDGGATFINIAKAFRAQADLKQIDEDAKLYLIVTHGIFSKGLDELAKYFDTIYCTNSVKDLEHPQLRQLTVI